MSGNGHFVWIMILPPAGYHAYPALTRQSRIQRVPNRLSKGIGFESPKLETTVRLCHDLQIFVA